MCGRYRTISGKGRTSPDVATSRSTSAQKLSSESDDG
jgi:hypothetical protein